MIVFKQSIVCQENKLFISQKLIYSDLLMIQPWQDMQSQVIIHPKLYSFIKSMNIQQPKCLSKGCSSTQKLYYCCKIDSPRCIKCPQPCSECGSQRERTLKSKLRSFSQITRQCQKCKTKKSKQWLNFSCSHSFCLKCVCRSLCSLIKSNVQKNVINQDYSSISCSCSKASCKITNLLQKYCFCCGQSLQQRLIYLNFGLKINASCQKRINYSSDSFLQGKTLISEAIYKELLPKCSKCFSKIEQLQESKDFYNFCKSCSKDQQKKEVNLKQPTKPNKENDHSISYKPLYMQKQKDSPAKNIQQSKQTPKRNQKRQCPFCEKTCDIDNLIRISQFEICRQCYAKQNKLIDQKMKPQLNKNGSFQKDSFKKKEYEQQSSGHDALKKFLYKNCEKCLSLTKTSELIFQVKQGIYMCQKCQKNKGKSSNSSNNTNKAHSQSNIEKELSDERCLICSSRFFPSMSRVKSQELGGVICKDCQQKNKSYQSYKGDSHKMNKSGFSKKNQAELPQNLTKIRSESKPQQSFRQKNVNGYMQKRIEFQPFSKNLIVRLDVTNTRNAGFKDYIPSIIQPQIQQTIVLPSITKQTLVSCFFCGYLVEQQKCFTIGQSQIDLKSKKVLVCTSCYVKEGIKPSLNGKLT